MLLNRLTNNIFYVTGIRFYVLCVCRCDDKRRARVNCQIFKCCLGRLAYISLDEGQMKLLDPILKTLLTTEQTKVLI